jgi:hypothetical protein
MILFHACEPYKPSHRKNPQRPQRMFSLSLQEDRSHAEGKFMDLNVEDAGRDVVSAFMNNNTNTYYHEKRNETCHVNYLLDGEIFSS